MEVISRKQAMADGLKHYFTGKPCKYGHISTRHISGGCKECTTRPVRIEKAKQSRQNWLQKPGNNLRKQALVETWRMKNKKHIQEYTKKWRKENRGLMAMHCREYEAAKIKRVPPWLTKDDRRRIKAMYAEANRLTRETGILMSVDHIIPLRGELVSGLHVPNNLRIIPFSENASKCNRYEPV